MWGLTLSTAKENTCLEHQHSDTPSTSVHSTTWYTIHTRQNTMTGHMGPDCQQHTVCQTSLTKHGKHSFSTQINSVHNSHESKHSDRTHGAWLSTANSLLDITNKAWKTHAWNTNTVTLLQLQYTIHTSQNTMTGGMGPDCQQQTVCLTSLSTENMCLEHHTVTLLQASVHSTTQYTVHPRQNTMTP